MVTKGTRLQQNKHQSHGFTLIELLAVIVVLAIIALIATPIVMNTIKSVQKGAAERSAKRYIDAVELAIASDRLHNDLLPDGTYTVNEVGNLVFGEKTLNVGVSGDKPAAGSAVTIQNGQVLPSGTVMIINNYIVTIDEYGMVTAMIANKTDIVGSMNNQNTITLSSSLPDDTYTLKYEDSGGIMTNYADICILKPGESYDDFILQNAAPQGATQIGVYNSSEVRVGSIIFTTTFSQNFGNKLYSFGVLSDVHIGYGDDNYASALTYLTQTENVSFITVAGDLTDSCTEWEIYQNIVNAYANGTPVYETTGNHDTPYWYGKVNGGYNNEDISEYTETIKNLVETYTDDSLYYSFTKGNDVFIMVGIQSNYGGRMFTQEELQWLYETLEANKDKRCFVFVHVPPDRTSGNANGWSDKEDMDGTEQTVFTSLLEHYSNVTVFHGHTHQSFRLQVEADDATYDNYLGRHSIHIPSVGGTRGSLSSDNGGSQGYVVDVYSNGIVLKGINFLTGEYLPIAQYRLDTLLNDVQQNTYVDNTHTINCEKANIEWTFGTHIDKISGAVASRTEYASSNYITINSDKKYYLHTMYGSPYGMDVLCYDASGIYIGYSTIGLGTTNKYTAPIELNSLIKAGTASIRLRMYTGTTYNRHTAPIFITAIESESNSDTLTYTNVLETVGYIENKRISGSSGSIVDNTGTYVTGLIPVTNGSVIRFKNIKIPIDGGNYKNNVALYNADGSYYTGYELKSNSVNVTTDTNGNIIAYIIDHTNDIAFLRISAEFIDENSIITVNQPIS